MPDTSTTTTIESTGLGSRTSRPNRALNEKDSTLMYVGLSLLLHLILLGATSTGYIRDYMDPQGAIARKAAAEQAAKDAAAPTSQPAPTPAPGSAPAASTAAAGSPGSATPAKPAAPANNAAAATGSKTEQLMNDRKDTPIVKKTTEAAKPSELPKAPDDLGLGLDDLSGPKKK